MHHLHLLQDLDATALAEITHLLDEATRLEGHAPIGEHKMAHLRVGAHDWDGILAYDGDHRLIGYAHLRWNPPGSDPRVAVEVMVHPQHRDQGVQGSLLGATRTTVARAGGGRMFLWVHRVEDPTETLAFHMGFKVQRELAFMRRPASPVPAAEPAPEGVIVRPYQGPADDEAFLEVNNAAFEGHPENGGWDAATFAARRELGWFDPAGLFMAFRDTDAGEGDPLGFHWTKWHTHEGEELRPHDPVGEVYVLAVHPRAQGLGVGRHLLRVGIRHLATRSDAARTRIVLYVDQAEPGPFALYRSEGFETVYSEVCYVDDVPPAVARGDSLLRPAD